ncbi:MAG: hypothetical protein LUQ50_15765 [Methanospirillum sp.]|uniref:hypothetical protein n=1 Tax=Methanospirillum sp. TaxID=45200 RepID=UPI002372D69E|nr:hypothetical protein [Methanospirillum sp.]MDD1730512.1 hypothetical protein [Methanospirillum sp.]
MDRILIWLGLSVSEELVCERYRKRYCSHVVGHLANLKISDISSVSAKHRNRSNIQKKGVMVLIRLNV